MGQAITDYVKFLADARDAVYRLNCDQNTAGQLADEEEMKERELETARKAVSDSVNQTIKKRLDEINSSYDQELGKGQERLKKARAKREKAKSQGVKERIAEETSELREHNRDLKVQMRTFVPEEPGARLVWDHVLLCSVLSQRLQGNYDFSAYPGNLLFGNSVRYLFFDSPESYLVSGGCVFCGCPPVWRTLCDDWQ